MTYRNASSHTFYGIVEVADAYFGASDEDGKRGWGMDKTPGIMKVQNDIQGRPPRRSPD